MWTTERKWHLEVNLNQHVDSSCREYNHYYRPSLVTTIHWCHHQVALPLWHIDAWETEGRWMSTYKRAIFSKVISHLHLCNHNFALEPCGRKMIQFCHHMDPPLFSSFAKTFWHKKLVLVLINQVSIRIQCQFSNLLAVRKTCNIYWAQRHTAVCSVQ